MNKAHDTLPASLVLGLLVTACQASPDDHDDRLGAWDTGSSEELGSDDDELMTEHRTTTAEDVRDLIPVGSEVGALKRRTVEGRDLTFVKHVDAHGKIDALILEGGAEVSEADVPEPGPRTMGRSLRVLLDRRPGDPQFVEDTEELEIVVALREPMLAEPVETIRHGDVTLDTDGRATVVVDGATLTRSELEADQATRGENQRVRQLAQEDALRESLRQMSDRSPVLASQTRLRDAIERGDASVAITLPKGQIESFLVDNEDLVAGLELYSPPTNLLAAAMQDTNVDPWALNYPSRHGEGIGVYMSEAGCPDYGHIGDYLRLSGSNHWHAEFVSAIIRGVSPDSFVYCRGGYTLPTATDLGGYFGLPEVHIETHSWGYANSDNDDYIWADRDFDNHVYDSAVSVFVANGNFGDNLGYTGSPAKALNVVSVGNHDDSLDTINPDSSYLDSEIGNEKPEITGPGTNVCAGGWCGSGTSMASPHAAGVTADMMGSYAWLTFRPYLMKALLLSGSDKSIAGDADRIGVGGLNFYRTYYSGTHNWWEGGNDSFSHFDSIDPLPDNGYIDREVFISASSNNVRIALNWLNRGWFTYDNQANAHPIGMDLDMCVFDPNGGLVGCSASWDNPYELVSFDPTVTGTYRVRVNRFANRDAASKLHMGMSINFE